jgi:type I restriction enzyme, S subunit
MAGAGQAKYRPYPAYKPSGVEWLGDIPEGWTARKLKFLSTHNDEVLSENVPSDWVMKYIDIGSVSAEGGIKEVQEFEFAKAPSRARRIVKHGDVLVSTVRTYLKAIAPVITPPPNLVASTGFAVIRPSGDLTSNFAAYALRTEGYVGEIVSRSVGVSYPAINASDAVQIHLPIPTIEEQIKIAAFLDHETAKIDSLIAKQQRLIALLEEKRQAVISHAVTKGLDPNVPLRPSGIDWLGDVPAHWEVKPLKYLCTFSGGGTPSKEVISFWREGTVPWVSPKDMKSFYVTETQDKITPAAVENSSTNYIKSGALLMVVRSGILQRAIPIAINKNTVTLNQDMKAIRFAPEVLAEYAANYILGHQKELLLEWSKEGATVESIEQEYLSQHLFPVPPVYEQEAICVWLSQKKTSFGDLTYKAQSAINLLQERRTALISAAVTGKIDLRDWQVPEGVQRPSTRDINQPEEALT